MRRRPTARRGVVDSARTADKAVTANNRHMEAITAVVRKLGVAKADIQTSNFSVFEDFGIGGRVNGFVANNTLTRAKSRSR